LAEGIIGKPLSDESVEDYHIQANTITSEKIANGSITNQIFTTELKNNRVAENLEFKSMCFSSRNIQDNILSIDQVLFFNNQHNHRDTQLHGILTPKNIPDSTIELKATGSQNGNVIFNVYRQFDNGITPLKILARSFNLVHIRTALSLFGWSGIKLTKKHLSPEVKQILVEKGGMTP